MSEFEAIYAQVRAIPAGRVMSYGDVGAATGFRPRTVGRAMANCPEDVPWQRVVGSDGYLRVARRDPHLGQMQQSLLKAEGVTVSESGYVPVHFFVDYSEDDGKRR